MIKVDELTKSYGYIKALRSISFEVQPGEIVGLLGPNGAGKSTAIKILTGYLHPDSGYVEVNGLDVVEHPLEVQAQIGYLSENIPLYPNLSVQGYLKLMAGMRGIPVEKQPELISAAIYATSMEPYLTRPIARLSKGLRQRVGLAQAILHRPGLLILDEPTVGLDPTQIVEVRHLIRRLAEHSTILFSSHILSEVEAICDRVIILMNGQIRADAYLDDLAATTNTVLVLQEAVKGVEKRLKTVKGVSTIEKFFSLDGYPAYRAGSADNADITPLIYDLARQENWPLRELRRDALSLEAIFNELATTAATETIAEPEVN